MDQSTFKQCQLCRAVVPYLLKHIRQVHDRVYKPGFDITCHLSGCTKRFQTGGVHYYRTFCCVSRHNLVEVDGTLYKKPCALESCKTD